MINRPSVSAALAAALALLAGQAQAQSGPPQEAPTAAAEAEEPPAGPPPRTVFYESHTIIITVRPPPATEEEARRIMSEPGPRCFRVKRVAGGVMLDPRTVMLKLTGGDRLQVTLAEDCPVIGYYGGFYISRQAESLCAGRDFLLARSGQRCAITGITRAGAAPRPAARAGFVKAGQNEP